MSIQLSTLPPNCNTYYTDCFVTGLSSAALDEKRANWKEVPGMGIGFAQVTHPDWYEVLKFAQQPTGHIWAVCEDGRRHIGLIYINQRTGKIELSA